YSAASCARPPLALPIPRRARLRARASHASSLAPPLPCLVPRGLGFSRPPVTRASPCALLFRDRPCACMRPAPPIPSAHRPALAPVAQSRAIARTLPRPLIPRAYAPTSTTCSPTVHPRTPIAAHVLATRPRASPPDARLSPVRPSVTPDHPSALTTTSVSRVYRAPLRACTRAR
ncbi:Unknown protein, partial [Striga hermonthica]